MSQTTDKPVRVMPSATPTEADLAAWAALPWDEQVRRCQEMFAHPDCNTFTNDTPDDILAAAYHAGLIRSFGLLADFPLIGQQVDELAANYRRFRFQSHLIF
jgi:hypothetical protein